MQLYVNAEGELKDVTSVCYADKNDKFQAMLPGDFQEKLVVKNNTVQEKLLQDIEEFLSDEEKMLSLKDGEVADANRDLYNNSSSWKEFMDHSLTRQEQFGRVDAIQDVLNLVKLSLGYKD